MRSLLIFLFTALAGLAVAASQAQGAVKNYPDGSIYEGELLNGQPNGSGFLQHPDGSYYDGQFNQGIQSGQGVFRSAEGEYYSGGFANDRFAGQGTLQRPDGARYTGGFQAGRFHGEGTLTLANGAFFIGTFKQGAKHGVFHFIPVPEGDAPVPPYDLPPLRVGLYENDRLLDSWESPDQLIYQGQWQGQQRHGHGALFQCPVALKYWFIPPNEKICEGEFKHGQAPRECQLKLKSPWEAQQEKPKKQKKSFPDGSSFSGSISDDPESYMKIMKGVFTFADGSTYNGSMKVDEMDGRVMFGPVTVTLPSGKQEVRLLAGGFPAYLDETKHEQAARIYEAAAADIKQQKFTSPQGDCALEEARKLIELGAITAARHIQMQIMEGYVALAEKAEKRGDAKKREAFMKRAREVAREAKESFWGIDWGDEEDDMDRVGLMPAE